MDDVLKRDNEFGSSNINTEISPSNVSEIDRELEELLKRQTAKVKVIGAGGGGYLLVRN
jgi:galactokinase/mevalonate kinase-like predicted kinase